MELEEMAVLLINNPSEDLEKIIKEKIKKESGIVLFNLMDKLNKKIDRSEENLERIIEVRNFIFNEFNKNVKELYKDDQNKVIPKHQKKK